MIAAPGEKSAKYQHQGLPVRRFAVSPVKDLRELYGEGDSMAAAEFGSILDADQPDLVHLHAFTRGLSLRLVHEAKSRGIPVVFTYHTPTVSCQRGTLLRWGKEVCDGKLDLHCCARCSLHGLGFMKGVSQVLGSLPTKLGETIGRTGLSGKVWTALRMTELLELRQRTFLRLMAEVNHIIVLCDWARDLLLRNGVPTEKISHCRHGLPCFPNGNGIQTERISPDARPIRVVFLGRLHPTKGVDTLIRAVRLMPKAPLGLDIYGVIQGPADSEYASELKTLTNNDSRIRFFSPLFHDQILSTLRNYHLLAVPSNTLETGPLVVLEAFAAGVAVIGSNLGGIAELIQHEVNGMLVEADSAEAWSQAIRRCFEDRGLLERLSRGIQPPRTMGEVAHEMRLLYEQALRIKAIRQDPDYLIQRAHARS